MKQVVIEGADIPVSRIALGTATLHHVFSSSKRQKLLNVAASAGISHFDTSPFYGFGLAECDVGALLKKGRSRFTVATKVGLYPWVASAESAASAWALKAVGKAIPIASKPLINWQVSRARQSFQQSLRRLGTDYLDFLFLHEPDRRLIDADEFQRWIEDEVARGAVRMWGLAGVAEKVAPWVLAGHRLARVVQTQDSLDGKEADFMISAGRRLQFTYGYLSASPTREGTAAAHTVLKAALERNTHGSIIVATRRADRIAELARLVG